MKSIVIFLLFLWGIFTTNVGITQCNVQASICEPGIAGPFNFQNGGHNSFNSTCLDQYPISQYAFIVLYITQNGNLNMLINGNASSGYLDVAVYNVPSGVAPCTAIQSTSNQIMCNYASTNNGCNQFGNAFGCSSSVPSVAVTAGQTIMIVVEDWENGPSTSFTLQLGPPPSAQTGIPDATITPAGPFCTTDGLMQLQAVNMGGTWTGPGVSPTGMFNPAAAGVGTHTINYSIGSSSCGASSSTQINVGSIAVSDMNVGACTGGVYNVSGIVNVTNPPSSGQLIVENCDGEQTVVATAPFSVGSYPFSLSGLTANGAGCDVHAYFTGSACSHILTYTAPSCPPDCGFTNITATPTGCQAGNTFTLNGALSFVNPPSSGQLIVQDCNGNTQTFNAPFTSPTNYSFSSLSPNGQACAVTAHFTAEPSCTMSTSYTAPSIPVVTASEDVAICPGASANLSASGATSYSWNNNAGNNPTAVVSPSNTTTYTVTGTTNGCTATDQVTVTVNSSLQLTVSPDVAICAGQSTNISVSGGVSYSWSNGLGSGDSHTVSPSSTTTYSVTATDANGCTGTNQITVTVNPNPVISATNVSLCESATAEIVATGANTYSWAPANYLNSTSEATVLFTPGSSITYTVTGTDVNGCLGTTTVSATVHPDPVIDAGSDVVDCEGNQVVLTASGAGAGGTYTWDNGAVNGFPFVPPVGTTVYTVTGATSNGCTATDFLTVNVDAHPVVSFNVTQDQSCVPVEAVFENTSSSGINCIWVFDNGQTVSGCGSVTQVFSHPGVYGASLYMESPNSCSSMLYQDSLVIVDATPEASFIPKPAVFPISNPVVNFENHSTGATSYIWDFGHLNSSSTETSPSYTYPEEEEGYVVTLVAISEGGCVDTVQYSVNSQEDLIFYIPNTFTPDGDEYNQTFSPVFTSGFDPYDYKLLIFNRWGEIVFESNDSKVGWKGTYGTDSNGNICQEGMYTWKIEFKVLINDERKMYVGHVNLLK